MRFPALTAAAAALWLLLPGLTVSAQEAPEIDEIGPPNAAGTAGADGRLDYGSPSLDQELIADHVFLVRYWSDDPDYGYTQEKPVMVGKGSSIGDGPKNEQRFLNALAGPNGERVTYTRRGSLGNFKTDNGLFGDSGVLDAYVVSYEGLAEPVILYLNMYDSDILKVPAGFTMKYAPHRTPPAAAAAAAEARRNAGKEKN